MRADGGFPFPFPIPRNPRRAARCALLLSLLLASSPLAAQQESFRRYSTADGLSQNYISAVVQDNRGFVWAGTPEAGLNRFDGREFRVFDLHSGLPSNTIRALASAGDRLYVGTPAGISCFRLDKHGHDLLDTLAGRFFSSLADSGWIRESSLALRMLGSDSLFIRSGSRAWIADLRRLHLAPARIESEEPGTLRRALPGVLVRDTDIDDSGRRWYATDLGLAEEKDRSVTLYDHSSGLPAEDVLAVHGGREGVIWIGASDGLYSFVPGRFIRFTNGRELPIEARGVWEIAESPDGAILFGTIGAGIVRWKDGRFSRLTMRDGLPSNSVAEIQFDSPESMICGTMNGIAFLTAGRPVRLLTRKEGLPDDMVEFIVRARTGGYWFSTHKGLVRYMNGTMRVYTRRDGLPSDRITQIAEDGTGTLWIGTHAGACFIPPGEGVREVPALKGIQIVSVMVDRRHRVWFGTLGAGAFRVAGSDVLQVTREQGLGGNTVYFIAEDRSGVIYFGTNGGVSIADGDRIDLLETRGGAAGSAGDRSAESLARLSVFSTLTSVSGLAGEEMNSGAVFLDRENDIWFGSVSGATRYRPGGYGADRPVFNLLLTDLEVGGKRIEPAEQVVIPPDARLIVAKCVLPGYRDPDQIRYLYRIEDLETSWHETRDGKIVYTGLPSGRYRLVIRATVGEGVWTGPTTLLEMEVQPHYYETPGFWILAFLVASGIGFGVHSMRLRHALDLERMRTRIASDLHDDIGASLGSAALLSDLERMERRAQERNTERIERISSLVRSASSSMNDIVWAVNPRNDTLDAVLERMRSFGETAAAAGKVAFSFEREGAAGFPVRADRRKNLLLLFKEAVNNAVKHARCTRIDTMVRRSGDRLVLTVRDDGKGFDPSAGHAGNGLHTMSGRAAAMGGSCRIESGSGGTTITVEIPAKA